MSQFYYTRKEPIAPKTEGEELTFKEYQDSINLNKVIRSIALDEGQRLVLLDDLHERIRETPLKNSQGRVTGYKREKDAFQSEIYLSAEDSLRFVNATIQ